MEHIDPNQAVALLQRALPLLERLSSYWSQFYLSTFFMAAILVGCFLLVERRLSGDVPKSQITDWLPLFYDIKLAAVIAASIVVLGVWLLHLVRSSPSGSSST